MAIIKDDDVRATRLRSGDLDGAILPPNLAKGFSDDQGKKTYAATSYDYRTVTLPPTTRSPGTPPYAAPSTSPSTARPW